MENAKKVKLIQFIAISHQDLNMKQLHFRGAGGVMTWCKNKKKRIIGFLFRVERQSSSEVTDKRI